MFSNTQFLDAFRHAYNYLRHPDQQMVGLPQLLGPDLEVPTGTDTSAMVLRQHPREIANYLEIVWNAANPNNSQVPHEVVLNTLAPGPFALAVNPPLADGGEPRWTSSMQENHWQHLIYALMLENTRIYDVFWKVIEAYRNGESLGVASADTLRWLEIAETVFYRQQSVHDHSAPLTLTSDIRPDGGAIRRNAYYRMFGMDVLHGHMDNSAYPYEKAKTFNREFVDIFEDLLRELWVVIINLRNETGASSVDDPAITRYSQRLRAMLLDRRTNGRLNREEFSAVAMFDWLRLTVSFDSSVVLDLQASATSEAERLGKIAERVGVPIHSRADDYFRMATELSSVLRGIETGGLTNAVSYIGPENAPAPHRVAIETIITHWSNATGKVLKRLPQQLAKIG